MFVAFPSSVPDMQKVPTGATGSEGDGASNGLLIGCGARCTGGNSHPVLKTWSQAHGLGDDRL